MERAWPHLAAFGLTVSDDAPKVGVTKDIPALCRVGFMQENRPDRLEVKQKPSPRMS